MKTKEFKEKFVDLSTRRRFIDKGGSNRYFFSFRCCRCNSEFEQTVDHQLRSYNVYNEIVCPHCSKSDTAIRMNEKMDRKVSITNRWNTIRSEGYEYSDKFIESQRIKGKKGQQAITPEVREAMVKKSAATRMENGTFMRSKLEVDIDARYGSVHSDPSFYYELDCYFPSLNLGIEVDDTTHYETANPKDKQKRQGYHYDKDQYFKSLGIKVLHLTVGSPAPARFPGGYSTIWDLIDAFLSGKYEGPLIMTNDPIYGDIIYGTC